VSPLALSFEVATLATVISGGLGVALGALLSRPRVRFRDALDVLFTLPLVLPPTVLGYYLLIAIGRRSAVGAAFEALTGSSLVFTRAGAVLAATVGALPLVVKSTRAALEGVDGDIVGAARTLGASPLRALLAVELPLARSGIVAGLMLAFARSLGDFGVTLMVAGNIPGETQTASLAIYDALEAGRDHDALVLVLILSAVSFFVLLGVHTLAGRVLR
jgi:molybdate transport system permease protein